MEASVYYPANTICSIDVDFSEQTHEQTSFSSPVTSVLPQLQSTFKERLLSLSTQAFKIEYSPLAHNFYR